MRPPGRVAAVACALASALAVGTACSQASEGERVTDATADKLATIRSGELLFRLTAGSGAEPGDTTDVGFELRGPFALPEPGGLPVARIDYTQITAGDTTTTQVIATGTKAFVVLNGATYQLPAAQVDSLRAPKEAKGKGGLSGLDIAEWIDDPRLSDGEAVDGVPTDRVQGTVDPVRTLNDLFAFGRSIGAGDLAVPPIEGDDAEQLRRVTQSATVDLLTGKEDRLLRRMAVDIRLAAHVPDRVKEALGELAAARIRFDLALGKPNTPVEVSEPAGALPASALPR